MQLQAVQAVLRLPFSLILERETMSGIKNATLRYQPAVTPQIIENGYVHLGEFRGGPNVGSWIVALEYYLSYEDFLASPGASAVDVSNDPNAPKVITLQDTAHMSPVDAALITLQEWWPQGTLVQ